MTAITANQDALKFWCVKIALRYVLGRTPEGQGLLEGYAIQILRAAMSLKVVNLTQARELTALNNAIVHFRNGTFRQSSKDKWATKVRGKGWEGFWIPFKDQLEKTKLKQDLAKRVSVADIGAGCDIVMFAIHGGGMVVGDALMFLRSYQSWMKEMQKNHHLKIGVLSIEYSLSPETPYPGALNQCVAAYIHLIEYQGIDPRRVVMCGDSAGGNLCLTTALKIRDVYPHIGLPAGQVLFSPWVMGPKPLRNSIDDYICAEAVHSCMMAYTQNLAKVQTSHYASPIRAPTLAGMPRMLIFVGGVETLRPSIESFVFKATADGVDATTILKENQAHAYPLIEEIAGRRNVQEADAAIGKFVATIRDQYIGLSGQLEK
ncbi:hypothetical protein EC968_005484 [Mortierella alpina]|nr:hypothetical protein EC968_005484 [Mortierella alpina]